MPIVELDTGQRIETDDTSPEAIDEIAAHIGGGQRASAIEPSASASTTESQTSPGVFGRTMEGAAEAIGDLGRPIEHAWDALTRVTPELEAKPAVPFSARLAAEAGAVAPFIAPEMSLA